MIDIPALDCKKSNTIRFTNDPEWGRCDLLKNVRKRRIGCEGYRSKSKYRKQDVDKSITEHLSISR